MEIMMFCDILCLCDMLILCQFKESLQNPVDGKRYADGQGHFIPPAWWQTFALQM